MFHGRILLHPVHPEGSRESCAAGENTPTPGRKPGAIEGTRTPTPLPVHGPEPCASANSATMAIWTANAAAALWPPSQEDQHLYFTARHHPVKPTLHHRGTETRRKPSDWSLCS